MKIDQLQTKVTNIIEDLKNHGKYPNENNLIDYKKLIKINTTVDGIENFLRNFWKDILSFWNGLWGIIFLWFNEDKTTWKIEDLWLDEWNLILLKTLDLNILSQKFKKITWQNICFDLQEFNIWTRKCVYFLIEKSDETLIPNIDYLEYDGLKKWEIWYRVGNKNQLANESTSELNRFIQIKANEKSKEFMEIWSNLLPEMVDINPKEVLILNPIQNKVYGFNGKDNTLSWSDIEIVQDENNIFNVILETIKAGEVWKITDTEWKPMYKIVGEMRKPRDYTILSSLTNKVKEDTNLNISWTQIKQICHKLWWVSTKNFPVTIKNPTTTPVDFIINEDIIWFEKTDSIKGGGKIVFSEDALNLICSKIIDTKFQIELFGKELNKIQE